MITIKIKDDNVIISTEDELTTGCTYEERQLLLSVAKALAEECKEGAEWIKGEKYGKTKTSIWKIR